MWQCQFVWKKEDVFSVCVHLNDVTIPINGDKLSGKHGGCVCVWVIVCVHVGVMVVVLRSVDV